MSKRIGDLFYLGASVLSTVLDAATNTILAQLGDVATESTDGDNADWWQHVGFASRPSKPVKKTSAAECVALRGNRDAVIASRDVRGQQIYGNLKDGETCTYAGGADGNAQGRVMYKADGSVTLMTTDTNTASGKVVAFKLSPTALAFSAPWGSFVFDAAGFRLKTAAGPRIDMGGISIPGIPSSLTGLLTSYIKLTAANIKLNGALVELGIGPSYGTCLQAPSSALVQPITAVMTGSGSQSSSVRVSTP